MTLTRLIYLSQAIPDLKYPDLKAIMEKSETNNGHVGITGLLCYGDGLFLQALEGDRRYVTETFLRIAQDGRHHSAEVLHAAAIEVRAFPTWSMKLVQLGEYAAERVRQIHLKYSAGRQFNPGVMTTQQCLNFMVELDALT
ncbi:MAG: BLUF domain-containing protein [Gloeomargaritaceae cyanobacterium C42_A2020_066]|nr:BLUF domain-containing protein [Gloeomargaritaceae cyanobacterium C42_A2020_066]